MISESEFTVQGHGVHTAYKEITDALRKRKDIDIEVNSDRPADIVHIQTMGLYSFRHLMKKGGKKLFLLTLCRIVLSVQLKARNIGSL